MWTVICYDIDDTCGECRPYVRLIPPFTSDPGWGISLGRFFETEEQAKENAGHVDAYMNVSIDHMVADMSEFLDTESIQKIKKYFQEMREVV